MDFWFWQLFFCGVSCAGIVLTEMQLEQEGAIKDLKIKRVCTGQGHYRVYFGIAHLQPGARGVLE